MVSMTGFVTRARGEKQRKGWQMKAWSVDKMTGSKPNLKHIDIYKIYLYIEGYSHTWLVSSAMVAF